MSLLFLQFRSLSLHQRSDVIEERTKTPFTLLEHIGVLEVVFQLSSSLDSCIANLAHFDGVESVPLPVVKLFVEVDNKFGVDEVEEGVPHVAVILNEGQATL